MSYLSPLCTGSVQSSKTAESSVSPRRDRCHAFSGVYRGGVRSATLPDPAPGPPHPHPLIGRPTGVTPEGCYSEPSGTLRLSRPLGTPTSPGSPAPQLGPWVGRGRSASGPAGTWHSGYCRRSPSSPRVPVHGCHKSSAPSTGDRAQELEGG